nr:MAG TPA: hypothetical protein [Caudoviricetes sp.]
MKIHTGQYRAKSGIILERCNDYSERKYINYLYVNGSA